MKISTELAEQEILLQLSTRARTTKPLISVVEGGESDRDCLLSLIESDHPEVTLHEVDLTRFDSLAQALTRVFGDDESHDPVRVWRHTAVRDDLVLINGADRMSTDDVELFWLTVYRGFEKAPMIVLSGRPGLSELLAHDEFEPGRHFTVLRISD